jgi:hypothetical protein
MIMLSEIKLPSTFSLTNFQYSLGFGSKRRLIQSQLYIDCIDFSLARFLDVLPEGRSSSHFLKKLFKRLYVPKAVSRLKALSLKATYKDI